MLRLLESKIRPCSALGIVAVVTGNEGHSEARTSVKDDGHTSPVARSTDRPL